MGKNIVRCCYNAIHMQFSHNFVNLLPILMKDISILNYPQPHLQLPQLGTCILNELGEEKLVEWVLMERRSGSLFCPYGFS